MSGPSHLGLLCKVISVWSFLDVFTIIGGRPLSFVGRVGEEGGPSIQGYNHSWDSYKVDLYLPSFLGFICGRGFNS